MSTNNLALIFLIQLLHDEHVITLEEALLAEKELLTWNRKTTAEALVASAA